MKNKLGIEIASIEDLDYEDLDNFSRLFNFPDIKTRITRDLPARYVFIKGNRYVELDLENPKQLIYGYIDDEGSYKSRFYYGRCKSEEMDHALAWFNTEIKHPDHLSTF